MRHMGTRANTASNREQRRHPDRLYDWAGAAKRLGTSERHVRKLWAERRLSGIKVGNLVRFAGEDLARYISDHRVEAVG